MRLSIHIASSWDQLSSWQLRKVCLLIHNRQKLAVNNRLLDFVLYAKLVKVLLRGNSVFKRRKAFKQVAPSAFEKHLNFLFTDVTRTVFLDNIRLGSRRLYAPMGKLRNSTIAEFAYADAMFYHWKETGNVGYLNRLCAALYRAKNSTADDNDIRKPFNKLTAINRHSSFERLPLDMRLAIAASFEGCRNHIVTVYPEVFRKSITTDPNKKQKYVPFGELIIAKINHDPSKLNEVQSLLISEFFNIYNHELRELRKRPKIHKK